MSFETSLLVLAWIAILLLAFAMAGMMRQIHVLSANMQPAHASTANYLVGRQIEDVVPALAGREGARIVVFADSDCESCRKRVRELDNLSRGLPEVPSLIALFRDGTNGFKSPNVELVGDQRDVFERLRISVTPFVLAVAPGGRILEARSLGSLGATKDLLAVFGGGVAA